MVWQQSRKGFRRVAPEWSPRPIRVRSASWSRFSRGVGISGKRSVGARKRLSSRSRRRGSGEKHANAGNTSDYQPSPEKWCSCKRRTAGSQKPGRRGKKRSGERSAWPEWLPAFTHRVGQQRFSLGMRGLVLALVLSAAVSLRGASRVLALWGTVFELPEAAPAW
jgi:hypothetical protein